MEQIDKVRARAALYHLLALLFDHPIAELHEGLVNGELQDVFRERLDLLGLQTTQFSVLTSSFQEYESDYIAWFEVGERGKPRCSLQASDYIDSSEIDERAEGSGQRTALFHMLLRFYHHFGLRLTKNSHERVLPDHLSCELEMMSFLCFREAEAHVANGDKVSYFRAQNDFLQRHLSVWVPRLMSEINSSTLETEIEKFFCIAVSLLVELINIHLQETSLYFKREHNAETQALHFQDGQISKPTESTTIRTTV